MDVRVERREKYHEADVVVVGGGVLGCALAYALAEQDRSVLLLERWMHEPDRIVGELMQPGGVQALRQLGLEDTLEGIEGVACYGYHVLYDGKDTVIPYPVIDKATGAVLTAADRKKKDDGAVPEEGCSFHHGRFIMQLRRRCLAHANISVVETEATALIRGQNNPHEVLGVEARTAIAPAQKDAPPPPKKADYFFGQLTIVCDGYASRFRAEVLPTAKPMVKSKFYALELLDCPMQPTGYGHVLISSSAFPVLLYQIGPRETRALIDVPFNLPAAAASAGGVRNYLRNVVLPSLPPQVQPCFQAALERDGDRIPRSMPNTWLPPAPRSALVRAAGNGVLLVGDAYNMRHPLTGGGMTVGLNDAVLLADLLAPTNIPDLTNHAAIAAALGRFHWQRKRLTSIINVLAMALYALFAADSRSLRVLRQGCFAYFQRGHAAEPMALMSGLTHRPLLLAYHFFSVAFLAIWLNAVAVVRGTTIGEPASSSPYNPLTLLLGILRLPLALVDGILVLWTACVVFLPVFWRELR